MIANAPHWVLTWMNDADHRTTGTLSGFKMVSAWIYNNDGLPNPSGASSSISNCFIHADDDAFKIYNSGSTIHNCVIWQGYNGAVFQFGWFPKTVNNVTVSNVDVIHCYLWYGNGQSSRSIFSFADAGARAPSAELPSATSTWRDNFSGCSVSISPAAPKPFAISLSRI